MKNICFQMNRKAWIVSLTVLLLSFPALAQKITVSGTVTDNTGEPLIGASVMAKGSQAGIATDFDGNYRLDVAPDATLIFSYVGYNTQEVSVNNRTTINVVLSENSVVLNEVVAIGYGVVKKSDATGSVAMIKPDDIEAGMATSAQDLLVGASPGVTVTTNGGEPTGNANIRIRGSSSLKASNDPLIVIDGVPMTNQSTAGGTNALTMINPQNIETMTILKDASATAIYGSRASNGVIIITTKKGKSGKPQINFAANWHLNTARKTLDMMDANRFASVMREYGNDRANNLLNEFMDGDTPIYNTDWQKEVLRTSFSQDYNLSVGGSAGVLPYRVNASYTNNEGIVKTSGMQRTTVGINLSPKFFNNTLSINANVSGSYVKSREADMGAIGDAIAMSPTIPVRYGYPTTGSFGRTMFNGYYNITQTTGAPEGQASQNPVQMLNDRNATGNVYSSNGNLQIDYALYWVPELHFNLNLGYQVSKNTWDTDIEQNSIMAWRGNYNDGAGTSYHKYELQRNTLLDFYINYRKDFTAIKSNLDVMAGYSWQRFDYHGREATRISTLGFNSSFGANSIYQGGSYALDLNPATESHIGHTYLDAPIKRWAEPLQLISFFGRVNYSFDDTYLLTFTLRNDGSSRFSKDNRWGLFPALALGWKIINMPFMDNARSVMNDFKLRLGWGETGQQDLGGSYFPYLPTYTSSYENGFHYLNPNGSGDWIDPLYPNAYNPEIKWERTVTWNVGIDLAFLENRITVAADWYKRDTKDLLSYVPVGGFNTSNFMDRNVGDLTNTGVEVTVTARPVVTRDFTWSTSLNFGYNKNEITALNGDNTMVGGEAMPSGTGGYISYQMVGEPAYTFMVYEQVYDAAGNPLEGQYVDQNADGVINDTDLIKFHSRDPKATFTWSNTLNYKNWDLGIVLRANVGNYVYNNPRYESSRLFYSAAAQYQLTNLIDNTYLFTKQDPKLNQSSYFVENASFIRCDNITLGYTFDKLLKGNLNLRLFGAVQNPFVITKYKGIDPEVFSGVDNNCYPRPVTCTLGLVASF